MIICFYATQVLAADGGYRKLRLGMTEDQINKAIEKDEALEWGMLAFKKKADFVISEISEKPIEIFFDYDPSGKLYKLSVFARPPFFHLGDTNFGANNIEPVLQGYLELFFNLMSTSFSFPSYVRPELGRASILGKKRLRRDKPPKIDIADFERGSDIILYAWDEEKVSRAIVLSAPSPKYNVGLIVFDIEVLEETEQKESEEKSKKFLEAASSF